MLLVLLAFFPGCQGISTSGSSPGSLSRSLSVTGTLDFGTVVVGGSKTLPARATNSGSDSLTINSATISSQTSAFSVDGLGLPLIIAPGQSVSFTVTFTPQTAETVGATVTFATNAQPATASEALSGTGSPAPTHTVSLSWNANTSPNISGYNVYRAAYANTCASFSRINALLNTSTLYTDLSVENGASYCYATTTVNSMNEESGYSNVVADVEIPAQ